MYSTKDMAKKLNISVQTLRNWDKSGKLKAQRRPSGRMFYTHDQYLEASGKQKYKCTGADLDAVAGKVVLITGGSGSLGNALCERICGAAKKVIIFSRCELKQAKMRQKFSDKDNVRFMIGNIRDKNRLSFAFSGVDIVIHAAALKRVEVNHYNPTEGIETNINGTVNVAEACIKSEVSKALFISSDKAVNPIIPYGFMKALGESAWVNFNNYSSGSTKFMCTRYGNVIDSNGSFYHLIKEQKKNGLIKVTDPNMTRFYMTLDEAVNLNLFALNASVSGEIFIPKLKSAKVLDFVNAFGKNTPVEYIGIRGNEKIAERLISEHEMKDTYMYKGYYKIVPNYISEKNQGWDSSRPKENPVKLFKYTSDNPDINILTPQDLLDMVNK